MLRERFPQRVHVLHREKKEGLGAAYLAGFRYALDHNADTIVQMDADFSHAPSTIPTFLAEMERHDVVVGSRYVAGGRVDPHWSWWRHGLSKWANSVYVRLILRLQVKDATAGFKCWSRAALAIVVEQPISSSGYIFQVEMAYVTEKLGLRVREVPIYFEDRHIGRSKMSMAVKLEAMLRTWQVRWRYRGLSAATAADPSGLPALQPPLSSPSR
jgi:dolichol-phosphate mannosyltransferase